MPESSGLRLSITLSIIATLSEGWTGPVQLGYLVLNEAASFMTSFSCPSVGRFVEVFTTPGEIARKIKPSSFKATIFTSVPNGW